MAEQAPPPPPITVLFGYDSSPFTTKIRLALKIRRIPYTFILVPSMMPRPILISAFNLTYRKIPILALGKELYIDTSLILEAIALHPSYPPFPSHPPLHPSPSHRTLTRLFSSHYTDRPFFRLTTGLIPQAVWETAFGDDRAGLIGHKLDAVKLGAKKYVNVSALDRELSILEPAFREWQWVFGVERGPTAADVALWYQLDWGRKMAKGEGIGDLTGGRARDGVDGDGVDGVFNRDRYPGLWAWYERVERYFEGVEGLERRVERGDEQGVEEVLSMLNACEQQGPVPLLDTGVEALGELDKRIGLVLGTRVSVAPDDTGRDDPTLGTLVGLSTQEVVIVPDLIMGRKGRVDGVRAHFPRVGFVIKPVGEGREGVRVTVSVDKAKL